MYLKYQNCQYTRDMNNFLILGEGEWGGVDYNSL